ncbi:MFS transporter [Rugosimonospora africana]|uniref:MFS transporter n=1 Tax=Rugosimonospora africana TaxID=556532 RepID=UPI0019431A59|nr:MFS transporter [Rugosimonospora africana]
MRTRLGGPFGRLLVSVGISGAGDGIRQTALPLLAAVLTGNPLGVSAVAVAQALPWLLVSLPAGALVDRWDRRTVTLVTNAVRAALAGVLAALVALGAAGIPALCLVAFALTVAETFADAAAQALLPALVEVTELERANSRLSVVGSVAVQFAGPPLGGVLFAVRRAVPFLADAVSFAAAALLLRTLPPLRATPAGQPDSPAVLPGATLSPAGARSSRVASSRVASSLRAEIAEGLRFLSRRPLLRALAGAVALNNLLMEAVFGILVLYALRVLHLGPAQYGLLFTAYALGGVLGGSYAVRVRDQFGAGPAVTGSMLLLGLPFLLIALVPNGYAAGVAMVAMGTGEGVWNVLTMSLRQAVIPDPLRGRVLSAFRMFGWGAASVGSALGGALAHALGLRFPVLLAGVVLPVAALLLTPVLSTTAIEHARTAAATPPSP